MKKLNSWWSKFFYATSGMGVNMLNLIMGSYLCSALIIEGFGIEDIGSWTYLDKTLVVAPVWAIIVLVAKIVDGVIDIPLATFTDNLKTRFGRRRPAILMGLIPMIITYLLFVLVIPNPTGATIGNTIFFGIMLCLFYTFYTLTMLTYYATFPEIVESEKDKNTLSNVKSVCDVVYFILGFAVLPMLIGKLDIQTIALIFLPLVLTMLIPLFMIKERSTKVDKNAKTNENGDIVLENGEVVKKTKTVNLFKSIAYTFKNKDFIIWMCVMSFMTFGVQLFLGGINEFFSTVHLSQTICMAASFVPVPLTLWLYNKIMKKKGFKFAFQYILLVYSLGMGMMFFCRYLLSDPTAKLILGICAAVVCSFAIGAMFSVSYSIPAHLAAEEEKKTGVSHPAMFFAVQGLFQGVATGLATGVVLTNLKVGGAILWLTIVAAAGTLVAFGLSFILPKSLANFGKAKKDDEAEKVDGGENGGEAVAQEPVLETNTDIVSTTEDIEAALHGKKPKKVKKEN